MTQEKPKMITWGAIIKAVIVVLGVLLTLYALQTHLESTINNIVNDEQFIKKVASHVQPYVIFDANEAIHIDGGAMQYLEKIEVKIEKREGSIVPVKINVIPKHHLAYPPLIETLGAERFMFTPTPKRGNSHQWIYECEVQHWEKHATKPISFRLEILR